MFIVVLKFMSLTISSFFFLNKMTFDIATIRFNSFEKTLYLIFEIFELGYNDTWAT